MPDVKDYIKEFERLKVVKIVDGRVEVAHDMLAQKIFDKRTPESIMVGEMVQKIKNRYREHTNRVSPYWLPKVDCVELQPFLEKIKKLITDEELEYVHTSTLVHKNRRRNLRILIAAVIGVISILAIFLYLKNKEKNETISELNRTKKELASKIINEDVYKGDALIKRAEHINEVGYPNNAYHLYNSAKIILEDSIHLSSTVSIDMSRTIIENLKKLHPKSSDSTAIKSSYFDEYLVTLLLREIEVELNKIQELERAGEHEQADKGYEDIIKKIEDSKVKNFQKIKAKRQQVVEKRKLNTSSDGVNFNY